MKYFKEIKNIVSEYDRIHAGLSELEKMTNVLHLRKEELEHALNSNKEKEKTLIDKIVKETGEQPDYYKIMQDLNA
jgi:hypothetical protein